eukprot:COSAG04_NODE_1059_length_8523_cov_2.419853_2_plen_475_part_00
MGTGLAPLALALIAFCTATPPLAAAQAPPPPPLSPIRSSDRSIHFFDAHGRVRIFHGAARVQKKPPWYFPDLLEGDTEARAMEALGFNVLRLGFMWSGYNPAPGVYNRSYVEVIKTTVAQLNAHGVYVLLDMHQDILSSAFCLYDGAPRWVIDKSTAALPRDHAYPAPIGAPAPSDNNCTLSGSPHSPCNCSWQAGWSENALTYAAANAYQSIYDNKAGMRDDMANMWANAAAEFKDTPGVIGYELMNEPFAGDIFSQPELVLPGVAGQRNLQKMHDAVAEKIREVDEKHIIFFEPVTWCVALLPRSSSSCCCCCWWWCSSSYCCSSSSSCSSSCSCSCSCFCSYSSSSASSSSSAPSPPPRAQGKAPHCPLARRGMIGSGKVSGSGFEHVPGGERWKNASAYAYHYYCMSWLPGWETQPVYRKLLCDAGIAPQVFKAVGEDIRRIGGAQMMTEGLACNRKIVILSRFACCPSR